jgi:hypothetical protein
MNNHLPWALRHQGKLSKKKINEDSFVLLGRTNIASKETFHALK